MRTFQNSLVFTSNSDFVFVGIFGWLAPLPTKNLATPPEHYHNFLISVDFTSVDTNCNRLSLFLIIINVSSCIAHNTSKWRLHALNALLPKRYPHTCLWGYEVIEGNIPAGFPICYTHGSRETTLYNVHCLEAYAPSRIRTHDPLITSRDHEPIHHIAPTYFNNEISELLLRVVFIIGISV